MSQRANGSLTRSSVNSIPRIFRSLSQALRITSPSSDIVNLVTFKDGKFVVSEDELINILENGTYQEQLETINLLAQEIINLTPSKRFEIWKLIERYVDLKTVNGIRNAALQLLSEVIKLGCLDTDSLMDCYCAIVDNINFKVQDKDIKWFLICLDELLKSNNSIELFGYYKEYPLEGFLFKLFRQITKYKQDDLITMSISLITTSVQQNSNLFSTDEMLFIVDFILDKSITTNNELVLSASINFFEILTSLNFDLTGRLYTLISIIGCANGLDDFNLDEKCELIFLNLLKKQKETSSLMVLLLKVIGDIDKEKNKHRLGDRYKIGCIRFLSTTLKYLGKEDEDIGLSITNYYKHHMAFILDVFIIVGRKENHSVKIEILKFIIELFETNYVIKKYYKLLLDKAIFWKLLLDLNWKESTVMTYSYQVLLELFNKLQNLPLNNFIQKELIEYFASNYSILTSYNIEYLLDYYSKNDLCVCGMANWKDNCKQIVEQYYYTSPANVFNVIKNAFMSCIQLKIDEPSLKFYTNLLCYSCVLNLSFPLSDDEMLVPIVDILIQLDDDTFDEVINIYTRQINENSSEINSSFLLKILMVYCITMPNERKVNLLMNEIIEITMMSSKSIDKKLIYHYGIMILTNLRLDEDKLYIKTISSIDDPKFLKVIKPIFKQGGNKHFENSLNINKLLKFYEFILNECDQWVYYFDLVKNLKLQVLNGILNAHGDEEVCEIFKILVKQLDSGYEFKFEIPEDFKMRELQLDIADSLYGFIELKDKIPPTELKKLVKYLIIDLKFDNFNRNQLVQFLNCCIYGIPDIMIEYLSSMIDIMNKSINEDGYGILILETMMTIYYNRDKYRLRRFDFNCIFNILFEYMKPIIDNEKELDREKYLLFILSYELCNWYLPIIPPIDNAITNYVTSKLSDVVFNGIIDRFQMATLSIDLIDFKSNDKKFNELFEEVNDDGSLNKRLLNRLIDWKFNLGNYNGSPFKVLWTNGINSIELSGKCIWVNKINDDNKGYYCINTLGFKKIMINDLIINSENVIKFVSTIIFICGSHIFMDL